MDKTRIPTTTHTLSNGFVLEAYNFLTQSEESEQLNILSGGQKISLKEGEDVTFSIEASQLGEFVKFKVTRLCKNLPWEEFDIMEPKLRKEVLDIIEGVLAKKN